MPELDDVFPKHAWYHIRRTEGIVGIVRSDDLRCEKPQYIIPTLPVDGYCEAKIARVSVSPSVEQCVVATICEGDLDKATDNHIARWVYAVDVEFPRPMVPGEISDSIQSEEHGVTDEVVCKSDGLVAAKCLGKLIVCKGQRTNMVTRVHSVRLLGNPNSLQLDRCFVPVEGVWVFDPQSCGRGIPA